MAQESLCCQLLRISARRIERKPKEYVTKTFDNLEVQIYWGTDSEYFASLLYYTGSKEFNVFLKTAASSKGFNFTSSGLYRDGKSQWLESEEQLFKLIGLDYIPPECRELPNRGNWRKLIEQADIQGVIHCHSNWSDGSNTIREMVSAALADDYNYLSISDHSVSSKGLTTDLLLKQSEEVKEIRSELEDKHPGFGLLHSAEVDILLDGSLDYPDEVLSELDFIIVSVHQGKELKVKEQTDRIIKAISNPFVNILAHPMGRNLTRVNDAINVDWDAIFSYCATMGVILEMNCNPARFDIDWRLAAVAKDRGCRFCINPDAHHINGLNRIHLGVMMARKAGLRKRDVVNSVRSKDEFLNCLER